MVIRGGRALSSAPRPTSPSPPHLHRAAVPTLGVQHSMTQRQHYLSWASGNCHGGGTPRGGCKQKGATIRWTLVLTPVFLLLLFFFLGLSSAPPDHTTVTTIGSRGHMPVGDAVVDKIIAAICDGKALSTAPILDGNVVADSNPRPFLDLRGIVSDDLVKQLEAASSLLSALVDEAFRRSVAKSPSCIPEETQRMADAVLKTSTRSLSAVLVGLDLGSSGLSILPHDFATQFPNLEVLFLTGNVFEAVPKCLASFKKLSRLSLKSNRLTTIDPVNELPLPSLVHLILTENRLVRFTSSLLLAGQMRKLMMAGNELHELQQMFVPQSPEELALLVPPFEQHQGAAAGMTVKQYLEILLSSSPSAGSVPKGGYRTIFNSLELLRLTRNKFSSISSPDVTKPLSLFSRLRWISFAGNPATTTSTTGADGKRGDGGILSLLQNRQVKDLTSSIDCADSNDQVKVLGHGTSGIVKQCPVIAVGGGGGAVAVKFFKKISSDGSGEDECRALALLPRAGTDACPSSLLSPCGFVQYSLDDAVTQRILPLPYASLESSGKGSLENLMKVAEDEFFTFSVAGTAGDASSKKMIVAMVFPLVNAKPMGKSPNMWTATDDIFDASTVFPLFRPTATDALSLSDRTALRSLFLLRSGLAVVEALLAIHAKAISVAHGDLYAHNIFFGTRQTNELCSASPRDRLGGDLVSRKLLGLIRDISPTYANYETLVSDFGASFSFLQQRQPPHKPQGGQTADTNGDSEDRANENHEKDSMGPVLWEAVEARSLGVFLSDMKTHVFPAPTVQAVMRSNEGRDIAAEMDSQALSAPSAEANRIAEDAVVAAIIVCGNATAAEPRVLESVRSVLTTASWKLAEVLSR